MINYIWLAGYFVLTVSGMVFLKKGGNSLTLNIKEKGKVGIQIGVLTMLGFAFYFSSFIVYQKLLIVFELSYLFPIITGVSQILVLILGVFLFNEKIKKINIIGLCILIVGMYLIAK